jgi:hypothetical protein
MAQNTKNTFLHGIENMTGDDNGNVYYKEQKVDKYNGDELNSQSAKREIANLGSVCEFLERHGADLSREGDAWKWDDFKADYAKEKQGDLDWELDGNGITFSKVIIANNWNSETEFLTPGKPGWGELQQSPEFTDFAARCDSTHGYEVSVRSFHYGGETETTSDAALALLPPCFEHMRDNNMLSEVGTQNYETERDNAQDNEQDYDLEDDDEEEMEG